jgi:hypothetical protein
LKIDSEIYEENGAGDGTRTRNIQLGNKSSFLCFQYLQNRSAKMYVHALHTVHALPDLRVAGGRLGDGVAS